MDDIYYHILSHYHLIFCYEEMIHFNQNCYLAHKFKTKIMNLDCFNHKIL